MLNELLTHDVSSCCNSTRRHEDGRPVPPGAKRQGSTERGGAGRGRPARRQRLGNSSRKLSSDAPQTFTCRPLKPQVSSVALPCTPAGAGSVVSSRARHTRRLHRQHDGRWNVMRVVTAGMSPCLVFCRARKPVITGSDVPCARFLPQCGSA